MNKTQLINTILLHSFGLTFSFMVYYSYMYTAVLFLNYVQYIHVHVSFLPPIRSFSLPRYCIFLNLATCINHHLPFFILSFFLLISLYLHPYFTFSQPVILPTLSSHLNAPIHTCFQLLSFPPHLEIQLSAIFKGQQLTTNRCSRAHLGKE